MACAETASTLIAEPQSDLAAVPGPGPHSRGQRHIRVPDFWSQQPPRPGAAVDLTNDESDVDINVKARQALIAALGGLRKARRRPGQRARVSPQSFPTKWMSNWRAKPIGSSETWPFFATESRKVCATTSLRPRLFRRPGIWTSGPNSTRRLPPCGSRQMSRMPTPFAASSAPNWPRTSSAAATMIMLLLRRNRAHWSFLAGDASVPRGILEEICETGRLRHPTNLGDACLLLGRAYLATGDKDAARTCAHGGRSPLRTCRCSSPRPASPRLPQVRTGQGVLLVLAVTRHGLRP